MTWLDYLLNGPWKGGTVPVKTAASVETIIQTRSILETKGWQKGGWTGPKGERCLLQALRDADGAGEQEAIRIVRTLIGMEIPTWNDKPERRWEDVREVLNAAQVIATELSE